MQPLALCGVLVPSKSTQMACPPAGFRQTKLHSSGLTELFPLVHEYSFTSTQSLLRKKKGSKNGKAVHVSSLLWMCSYKILLPFIIVFPIPRDPIKTSPAQEASSTAQPQWQWEINSELLLPEVPNVGLSVFPPAIARSDNTSPPRFTYESSVSFP